MPLEYSALEVIIEKIIETVRADLITANRLGTLDLQCLLGYHLSVILMTDA